MNKSLSIEAIKELYQQVVVRIATPYSTGTGFYLRAYNLIVTSEYIVRDNREVIVEGQGLKRQMVPVVFSDTKYDLAFLQANKPFDLPLVPLVPKEKLSIGDWVLAIGHPFDSPYQEAEGEIRALDYNYEGESFIEVDAHLQPGNIGGPVVNRQGEIVGVNTFLVRKNDQIDFALPTDHLLDLIKAYEQSGHRPGLRCVDCEKLVFAPLENRKLCPFCKSKITLAPDLPTYEPMGIARTIEHLIAEAGYEVPLARRGPNSWEIKEGSARVDISYYEKNGSIIGDAYLCELPPYENKALLEYLLKQNYEIEGLTFSIRHQTVVLSLLIYDRYFNEDTGSELFRFLFEKADYHDNILVELFGASWRSVEDR